MQNDKDIVPEACSNDAETRNEVDQAVESHNNVISVYSSNCTTSVDYDVDCGEHDIDIFTTEVRETITELLDIVEAEAVNQVRATTTYDISSREGVNCNRDVTDTVALSLSTDVNSQLITTKIDIKTTMMMRDV